MAITDHPEWKKIDGFRKHIIKVLQLKQAKHFMKYKRCFQGIRTPAVGQIDGITDGPIAYGLRPLDQEESWHTFAPEYFNDYARFPCHVKVDAYVHPTRGHGWKVTLDFYYAGLGPDQYGNDGDHWVYVYDDAMPSPGAIEDEWVIDAGGA